MVRVPAVMLWAFYITRNKIEEKEEQEMKLPFRLCFWKTTQSS